MCRRRGYQNSQTGPRLEKLNKAPYKKLEGPSGGALAEGSRRGREQTLDEGKEKVAESEETRLLSPDKDAIDLQDLGFAELYEKK